MLDNWTIFIPLEFHEIIYKMRIRNFNFRSKRLVFCPSGSWWIVGEISNNFLNFLDIDYRCTLDNIHSLAYRQKYDHSSNDDIERTLLIFWTLVYGKSILVITFYFILDICNGVFSSIFIEYKQMLIQNGTLKSVLLGRTVLASSWCSYKTTL